MVFRYTTLAWVQFEFQIFTLHVQDALKWYNYFNNHKKPKKCTAVLTTILQGQRKQLYEHTQRIVEAHILWFYVWHQLGKWCSHTSKEGLFAIFGAESREKSDPVTV